MEVDLPTSGKDYKYRREVSPSDLRFNESPSRNENSEAYVELMEFEETYDTHDKFKSNTSG